MTRPTSPNELLAAALRARRKASLLSVASGVLADAVEAARVAGDDASEVVAAYSVVFLEAERSERFADRLDADAEAAMAAADLAEVATISEQHVAGALVREILAGEPETV